MPVFEIQSPDGRILDIEAGDEAAAIAGAQQWVAANPKAGPAPAAAAPEVDIAALGVDGVAKDILGQAAQGLNRSIDAGLNLPYNMIRFGANALGADLPEAQPIVGQLNSGDAPQTLAGRLASTVGEVAGSSVIPGALPYAMAAKAAPIAGPLVQFAAKGGTAAPTAGETLKAVGSNIVNTVRADPLAAAKFEAASTVGSGLAMGGSREMGGGPVADLIAGLAGGMAPAAVPGMLPKLAAGAKGAIPEAPAGPPQAGLNAAAQPEPETPLPPTGLKTAPEGAPPVPPADNAPRKVKTPDGSMEIDATPQLVELDDLKLADGQFQPRDRSKAEYTALARERASNLDVEQLKPERMSDSGAPIVRTDNTILSGNGRALILSEVYRDGAFSKQAAAYRASLPPEAANMRKPVLIMRADGLDDAGAAKFADLSNRSRVSQLSKADRAARDGKLMAPEDMALYKGGDFDSPENLPFMKAFQGKAVSPDELTDFSSNGRLSSSGSDRMRAAVLASTFDDPDMVARLLERSDESIKGIAAAVVDAAPALSNLRAGVKTGTIKGDLDPTADIAAALKHLSDLRRRGTTVKQYFEQGDAFGRPLGEDAEAWLSSFYNAEQTNQLSRAQIASLMRNYADEAGKHAGNQMFPDETTRSDVLGAAWKRLNGSDEAPAPAAAPAAGGAPKAPTDGTEGDADFLRSATGGDPAPKPAATTVYGADGKPAGQADDAGNITGGRTPPPGAPAAAAGGGGNRGGGPVELEPNFNERPVFKEQPFTPPVPERIGAQPYPTRNEFVEAGKLMGVDLPDAAVSESHWVRGIAGRLASLPGIGAPLQRKAIKAQEQMGAARDKIVAGLGSPGPMTAGASVAKGLRQWITKGSDEETKKAYAEVHKLMRDGVKREHIETRKLIQTLKREAANSTSKSDEPVFALLEAALKKPGGMDYEGQLKLRQDVGSKLEAAKIVPDAAEASWKRAYGAMTADLRGVVHAAGGKKALAEFDKANNIAELIARKRDDLAKLVGVRKNDPKANESVLEAVLELASSKKSANIQKLHLVKGIVGKEAMEDLAAEAVARLGMTAEDGFSAAKFVTGYAKLSNNGKFMLFGEETKAALDALAKIALAEASLKRLGNPSGTAGAQMIVGILFGGSAVAGQLPSLAAGAALGYGAAAFLARPAAIRSAGSLAKAWKSLQESGGTQSALVRYGLAVRNFSAVLAEQTGGDERDIARELVEAMEGKDDAGAR